MSKRYEELLDAAYRLIRVDDGEPMASVYPNLDVGTTSATLVDTELLCDAWIDEHINGRRFEAYEDHEDLVKAVSLYAKYCSYLKSMIAGRESNPDSFEVFKEKIKPN